MSRSTAAPTSPALVARESVNAALDETLDFFSALNLSRPDGTNVAVAITEAVRLAGGPSGTPEDRFSLDDVQAAYYLGLAVGRYFPAGVR